MTLYRKGKREPTIDQADKQILSALQEQGELSTKQIANLKGRSSRATRTRMIKLVDRGFVVEIGTGPRDPRKRYAITRNY